MPLLIFGNKYMEYGHVYSRYSIKVIDGGMFELHNRFKSEPIERLTVESMTELKLVIESISLSTIETAHESEKPYNIKRD